MRPTPGESGLPKVVLTAPDGARAEVYLHGAHVTSWVPAGGTERLFLSPRSAFKSGAAIRGGVPVIFPQFANQGPLPKHGFARTSEWRLVEGTDDGRATFEFSHSAATRAIWPGEFDARFTVGIDGDGLDMTLEIQNSGKHSFTFTAALHTYLAVADIRRTFVRGLSGLTYRDSTAGGAVRHEESSEVAIAGEVDGIYLDVSGPVDVIEPSRITRVTMDGFRDVVVWNPGPKGSAALADMEPDGYLNMLCVEAAAIGQPITLAPSRNWKGTQRLEARGTADNPEH